MAYKSDRALAAAMREYAQLSADLGRPEGRVTLMRGLPLADSERCRGLIAEYAELGVERLVCAIRYDTTTQFRSQLDSLAGVS